MALTACAQTPQTGYTINGQLTGLNDGDTLYLSELSHVKELPFDTAVVQNGTFTFSGQFDEPRGLLITAQKGSGATFLMVADGEQIVVKGSVETQGEEGQAWLDFKTDITGSPTTDLYHEKEKYREALNDLFERNQERHKAVGELLGQARMTKNQAMIDSIMQTDAYKALEKDESDFFAQVQEKYQQTVKANADSWWGPFLMIANTQYFQPQDSALYNQLSETARQSYYGQKVAEEIFPQTNIGKPVPDFTVRQGEKGEKPLTLVQALEGKKYLIIDFWASWCGPCRKSIPNLKEQYRLYKDKGLEILSISIDKDEKAWTKACNEEQLPWLSYRDVSGVDAAYKVQFIPAMFIIDSEGRLVSEKMPTEELNAKLAELFSK